MFKIYFHLHKSYSSTLEIIVTIIRRLLRFVIDFYFAELADNEIPATNTISATRLGPSFIRQCRHDMLISWQSQSTSICASIMTTNTMEQRRENNGGNVSAWHGNGAGAAYNIEKLNGVDNYTNWKFIMRMALTLDGLWGCVEGTDTDTTRDQRALARICMCLQTSLFQYVRDAKTAKEAWNMLAKIFEDKGLYRRVLLSRQLHQTEFNKFSSMSEYIHGVMTLVQQLADIGKIIEDAEVAEILLSGLPVEYDVLVSNLETACISKSLTSELVRTRLLQEEFRKVHSDLNNSAYVVKTKSKVICHYCKKVGHMKSKCFKLKRDRKCESEKTFITTETALVTSNDWVVDSGCTAHMTNNKKHLMDFKLNRSNVCIANNDRLSSIGSGKVKILFNNNDNIVAETMLVPDLSTNLLSVSKLTKQGFTVVFDKEGCHFYNNCKIVGDSLGHATNEKGIYKLDGVNRVLQVEHSTSSLTDVQGEESAMVAAVPAVTWHKRLGHLSYTGMCTLRKANHLKFQDSEICENQLKNCVPCLEGKQVAKPFPSSAKRATQPLELVHSDVCGPMSSCSWGGARYLLTFTDDFSRKSWGYLLRNKSEVLSVFIQFKTLVEKQSGYPLKCLRSDGGGEYCNSKFATYLIREGIVHQVTVPYSPQQNGVSERLNRTLMEKARSILQESGLCQRYWGEAVMTAVYLKNRCPSVAVAGSMPEEVWTRSRVELGHLRVFGCVAYALIPEQKRKKLDAKSRKCIFVGYSDTTKGYRLVDPLVPHKVFYARNVAFLETEFLKSDENKPNSYNFYQYDCKPVLNHLSNNNINDSCNENDINNTINNDVSSNNLSMTENIGDDSFYNQNVTVVSAPESEYATGDEALSPVSIADVSGMSSQSEGWSPAGEEAVTSREGSVTVTGRPARSTRGKQPARYGDYDMSMLVQGQSDPMSYDEAISSSTSVEWEAAMQKEYNALIKNGVWKLVDRPKAHNVVKCKWVYKTKQDNAGKDKYRARLVARGFSQKEGIDYNDTFSPVVRHSTMRILFALANDLNMNIDHLDVETAFLNSDLDEHIFMEQPEGFNTDRSKVCLLLKSIYGLKQASRMWNLKVHQLLSTNGFTQSKCEPCVYIKKCDKCITIIALYVDDFYLFSNSSTTKNELISLLEREFNVKNLGTLKTCLGMNVTHDKRNGILTLDQSDYIKRLLSRFGMENCKAVATPMVLGNKLCKPQANCLDENVHRYRELLGCLMYLCVCTRPDLSFACSQLSQFAHDFDQSHWLAAKRILRYLAGTINYKLYFYRNCDLSLTAFADADWANDVVDRKSYTGYVIKLGRNTINWESRKQKCVALSSTESEYLGITEALKDLCFIKSFMSEILDRKLEIILFNDNQSAHKLLEAKEHCHKRTKHIDLRYHFVKDLIQNGFAKVMYMSTDQMMADVLTKPLSSVKHTKFVKLLNIM